jgi:hypothetical protein
MGLNILFEDLTEDAQKRVLEFYKLKSPSDGNLENNILFILEEDVEDEDDERESKHHMIRMW